jgi:hypothetical protein
MEGKSESKKSGAESTPFETLVKAKVTVSHRKRRLNGSGGSEIPYQELNLEQPWEQFDIEHELTKKGIQKFVSDYSSTLRKT